MTRPSVAAALPAVRAHAEPRPRSLRALLVKATWGGEDAHGGVPFDQKHVWRQGYDEARRQLLAAAARIDVDYRPDDPPAQANLRPRCWRCDVPLDDADVVTLAGVGFCVACAERETGEVR